MTTPQPEPHDPHDIAPASRAPDRVLALLIALALVPPLGFLLLVTVVSGPQLFFGEYSSAGGRHAVLLACLTFVASACWVWFFASYRRAAPATLVGLLVAGASALSALVLLYLKLSASNDGSTQHGRDNPDTLDPMLVATPISLALTGAMAALALRHPNLRALGFVTAACLATGGCWLLVPQLANGERPFSALAVLASPLVLGSATAATLWRSTRTLERH